MINHKHKFIFVHIPHTAGTSIEEAFGWYIPNESKEITNEEFALIKDRHLTGAQSKRKYKKYWDDYFVFTIIRNPFDYLVSSWASSSDYIDVKNRYASYGKYLGDEIIYKRRERRFSSSSDRDLLERMGLSIDKIYFKDYVNACIDYKRNLNQTNMLGDLGRYDFIGKFEDIENSWQYICKELGVEIILGNSNPTFNLKKKHYSHWYTKDIELIDKSIPILDDELIDRVADYCSRDLETFDYKFDYGL